MHWPKDMPLILLLAACMAAFGIATMLWDRRHLFRLPWYRYIVVERLIVQAPPPPPPPAVPLPYAPPPQIPLPPYAGLPTQVLPVNHAQPTMYNNAVPPIARPQPAVKGDRQYRRYDQD